MDENIPDPRADRPPRILAEFDRETQTRRQTEEWKKLAQTVRLITPRVLVELVVGVIALALAVVFFVLTSDEHSRFGTAAVICALIAALGLASGITDMVLAREKRAKMLPRLLAHLESSYAGLPSPCPFAAEFDGETVHVAVGRGDSVRREDVPLSAVSAVEFDGMVMFDFGRFMGICLTFGETGEDLDDIRSVIRENGESYRYLEPDGNSVRLWEK